MGQTDTGGLTVFQNDGETLVILNGREKGLTFLYTTDASGNTLDCFQIGISWISIGKILEKSSRSVFNWSIKDKSLDISGRSGIWSLNFHSLGEPISAHVVLTKDQSDCVRSYLAEQKGVYDEAY